MLKITLFLHLIAALFWVGGMLFLVFIIAPFLMTIDPKERSRVYQFVGQKYRKLAWIAIAILLITGPLNLYFLGIPLSSIVDSTFLSSPYGRTLLVKLILVAIIIISSLIHDFYLGPKARSDKRYSFLARTIGRTNLFIALFIALFAVFLRLGGI
jgi:putative copper export protein